MAPQLSDVATTVSPTSDPSILLVEANVEIQHNESLHAALLKVEGVQEVLPQSAYLLNLRVNPDTSKRGLQSQLHALLLQQLS